MCSEKINGKKNFFSIIMCKQLEALAAKSQQEWHWSSQEPPKKSDQGNEMTRRGSPNIRSNHEPLVYSDYCTLYYKWCTNLPRCEAAQVPTREQACKFICQQMRPNPTYTHPWGSSDSWGQNNHMYSSRRLGNKLTARRVEMARNNLCSLV